MKRFRHILRLVWQVLVPYEMVRRSKQPTAPSAPIPTSYKIKHSA